MASRDEIHGRVRKKTVTDEGRPVSPALLGRPLSPYWRRSLAFCCDVVLAGFVGVAWNLAFLYLVDEYWPGLFADSDFSLLLITKEYYLRVRETADLNITIRFSKILGNFLCSAPYFVLFPWATNGWTPFKWIFRIRIARLDGQRVGFLCALERYAGLAVSGLTLGIGALQILWDHNRQASHDKLSKTVVVRM
jgi:uncharacterized RDD family membrane protein YckC